MRRGLFFFPIPSNEMKPFFCFFGGKWSAVPGGKWRVNPCYPAPKYDHVIEPFAGAAGYSLRFYDLKITLIDADPVIAGVWDFLIHASTDDILRLPLKVLNTDDLHVCQEAKWLIGFWLNKGCSSPRKTPSAWMRSGTRPKSHWGIEIRDRIAFQVNKIRHWKITCASYESAKNETATWFVDPPYHRSGRAYRKHFMDYEKLAKWCRSRRGQVTVCEQPGATWLPFVPFKNIIGQVKSSSKVKLFNEMIWTK